MKEEGRIKAQSPGRWEVFTALPWLRPRIGILARANNRDNQPSLPDCQSQSATDPALSATDRAFVVGPTGFFVSFQELLLPTNRDPGNQYGLMGRFLLVFI